MLKGSPESLLGHRARVEAQMAWISIITVAIKPTPIPTAPHMRASWRVGYEDQQF